MIAFSVRFERSATLIQSHCGFGSIPDHSGLLLLFQRVSLVGCDFAVKEMNEQASELFAGKFVAPSTFNDAIWVLPSELHSANDLFPCPRTKE